MKLKITMELDNAAFADIGTAEVARVLVDLCNRMPRHLDRNGRFLLHDMNGNYCGTAELAGEHDDNDD